jgi:hypothetical protein
VGRGRDDTHTACTQERVDAKPPTDDVTDLEHEAETYT